MLYFVPWKIIALLCLVAMQITGAATGMKRNTALEGRLPKIK